MTKFFISAVSTHSRCKNLALSIQFLVGQKWKGGPAPGIGFHPQYKSDSYKSVSSDADERSDSGLETQKETARTCSDFLDLGAPSTLPFRGLGFHLPHSSFATGGVGLDS